MKIKSLWKTFSQPTHYSSLKGDVEVDVVIIGGGITGLTTASVLEKEKVSVVVLEALDVCGGTTSHSTGNVYVPIDQNFSEIKKKFGLETLKKIIDARTLGLKLIENNIRLLGIECNFKKVPWTLYTCIEGCRPNIQNEFETGKEIGLPFLMNDPIGLPYEVKSSMSLPDQAQLNPMKYGQALASSLKSPIYEHSPVIEIKEEEGRYFCLTPAGTVIAKHVVHATHSPKGIFALHTLLGPYREYGVALKIRGSQHPQGIFWGFFEQDEIISTRHYREGDEEFLVVVGKPHKVGQEEDNTDNLNKLEEFARNNYDVIEVTHRWAGQHYRPADLLPYIGRTASSNNTYVATGFSTDGLVWGAVAAMIIRDEILQKVNPFSETFSAARITPVKSASHFIQENLNVMKQYLKDLVGSDIGKNLDEVRLGDGKVIERDGKKLAVHRDDQNQLHVCSAVCTHMACLVNWNSAEKSWDCPCHGSRFDHTGTVLEGPAILNLEKLDL